MSALDTSKIIAVIGAGTMGAGVAQVAAKAGHPVLLFDVAEGAAQKGINYTAKGLDKLVERGRMSQEDKDALISRITPAATLEDLSEAALVVEAIVENLDIKQQLFGNLEAICGEDTILASNTSSISLTAIGAKLKRPENLVGMHFFNPAPIMKLVEIISGLATAPSIAETTFDTATAWGKQAVHAKSTPGFIVNRVARPFYAEGLRILQEGGADAATIDAIMRESGGFRMGPFELMDLIGHDVNYAVTSTVHASYYGDPRFMPSLIQKELVDGGFLGRKSGRGFFDYSEGTEKPTPVTAEKQPVPSNITIKGDSSATTSLLSLIQNSELQVSTEDTKDNDGFEIQVGSAHLCLTDGRMATERANSLNEDNLVLFDLALDYEKAARVALAPAEQCNEQALNDAIGFFQALGKSVSVIEDIPGMCAMRTVCMLANEGADAVNQQVCNTAAVDIAMKGGVNYPQGPLEWADSIGLHRVEQALNNLANVYGEDRYRTSPLIHRKVQAGRKMHD